MKKQDWINCVNSMICPQTVTDLSAAIVKLTTYRALCTLPITNYGTGATVCGGMGRLSPGVCIMNDQEHVN
jgi:hypothetical protein